MKSRLRDVVAALLAGLLSIMTQSAIAQGQDPIVIGVTYDAAKQASYYSLLQKQALEVLESEVNAAGGVLGRRIRFEFADDQNDPVVAAQRVEQLNAAKIVFLIEIGSSATGLAAQQKAQELGIPNGSPGNTNVRLTSPAAPSFYFRTGLLDVTQTQALVLFIRKNVSNPKVALVTDSSQTGLIIADATADELKKSGFEAVTREQIPPGSANVTAQALRVQSSGANVVLVASAALPEVVAYVKAHRQLGISAVLVGLSPLGVPDVLKLAGSAAEGVVFTDIVDFERADVSLLNKKLVAAKGQSLDLSPQAIFAYEFGQIVLDAIKAAGSVDRKAIRDAMEKTTNRPSLLGPAGATLSFSPTNHDGVSRPEQVVFRAIKNGKYVTYKPN